MGETAVARQTGLFGSVRDWSRECGVAAAAGLFLGLIGPFGSYLNPSRLTVLGYWIGALLLGTVLSGLVVRPALRLAPRLRVPSAAMLVGSVILMSVPLSFACHLLAVRLWPGPINRIQAASWYLQTLIISLPLACCHYVAAPRGPPATPSPGDDAVTASRIAVPDFRTRLPSRLGTKLVALQMEDHYVRAHTSLGSALVLIPLRQALTELAAVPGIRTHRSWWVARDAVSGSVQDGRNLRLRLLNDLEAPVSRANVAMVRSAGLLDRP